MNDNYFQNILIYYKRHLFFFCIILNIIIKSINSKLSYFSAINSYSGNIILFSNDGICFYNRKWKNITYSNIESNNQYIVNEQQKNFVGFGRFPKNKDYILAAMDYQIFVCEDDIFCYSGNYYPLYNNYKLLIPYKEIENYVYFILAGIEHNTLHLVLFNATIRIVKKRVNIQNKKNFNYQDESGENSTFSDNMIACDLIPLENLIDYNLVCFIGLDDPPQLLAYTIDIENNFTVIDSAIYNGINETIYAMKSILNEDNKTCFICYAFQNYKTECIIYDSKNNIFKNPFEVFNNCKSENYAIDFIFLNNSQEYIFFCFSDRRILNIFTFDINFNLKPIINNDYSKRSFILETENSYSTISSTFLYLPDENQFIIVYSHGVYEFVFDEKELCLDEDSIYDCNLIIENDTEFNISIINNSEIINNIYTDYIFYNKVSNEVEEGINITKKNKKYIFDNIENILTVKIEEKKEEILNILDNIITEIDIGNNYKISGTDYNINIFPINDNRDSNSTFIDLGECETILRDKYNLSSEEIISIMQIEINPSNEKILGNQIEYSLFDNKKNKLDLSLCKDVPIIIDYKIYNTSVINKTMVLYYSNLNIDIFNIEDNFFVDICYPYSMSDTDVILQDRRDDIYQNFSLCEDNCEYQKFNAEALSVQCKCKIKTQINVDLKPPAFHKVIANSFKDSNFGVIKCFNQVFKLSNKLKNAGFMIALIILLLHIPLFIIYFIQKIKSVKEFIFKEMEKNNYLNEMNNVNSNVKAENNETIISINDDEIKKSQNINDNNRTQTELSINPNVKFKRREKKLLTCKEMRTSINYSILNEPKENKKILLSIEDISDNNDNNDKNDNNEKINNNENYDKLKFTSSPKKEKNILSNKINLNNGINNNLDSQSLTSEKKKLKPKKRRKCNLNFQII